MLVPASYVSGNANRESPVLTSYKFFRTLKFPTLSSKKNYELEHNKKLRAGAVLAGGHDNELSTLVIGKIKHGHCNETKKIIFKQIFTD